MKLFQSSAPWASMASSNSSFTSIHPISRYYEKGNGDTCRIISFDSRITRSRLVVAATKMEPMKPILGSVWLCFWPWINFLRSGFLLCGIHGDAKKGRVKSVQDDFAVVVTLHKEDRATDTSCYKLSSSQWNPPGSLVRGLLNLE